MGAETKSANCHILKSTEIVREFSAEQFDPVFWQNQAGFRYLGGGRAASCLIDIDGRAAVLRRYHRGGLVGRILSDQYFWLGKRLSRPWREWKILLRAREAGLPVPEPIAACVCRSKLSYRAALVTAYLDDTEMLTSRLEREPLARGFWQRLGILIRQMHEAGIRHADLTSDNILIDSHNGFYLVDFDRARIMSKLDDWQWRPLFRFQRSMKKRDRRRRLHYDVGDWQAFMAGYQG